MSRKYSLNEIIELWLEDKAEEVKVQTIQRYESLINNYIQNTIGVIDINYIDVEIIQNFFREGKLKNRSSSIKKALFYILRSSLQISYDKGISNFIDLRKIKFKTQRQNIIVFSKREQRKLDKFLTKDLNVRKAVMLICMYTGIRVGEASGLKWEDIDFTNHSITIRRTIQRIKTDDSSTYKTKLVVSTPKSESSNRIVPLPSFIIPYLKKLKKSDKKYILTSSNLIYDPRLLESFYERTLQFCHIRHLKFHTLRHTFATRCIESNVDPKTLSEMLGHSSVEITLKLYVHPTYAMKKESIEKMTKYVKNGR